MWKWNLSPYTSRGKDNLEVTVDDATFVEIVNPAATAALKALRDEYPAKCQKVKVGGPSPDPWLSCCMPDGTPSLWMEFQHPN